MRCVPQTIIYIVKKPDADADDANREACHFLHDRDWFVRLSAAVSVARCPPFFLSHRSAASGLGGRDGGTILIYYSYAMHNFEVRTRERTPDGLRMGARASKRATERPCSFVCAYKMHIHIRANAPVPGVYVCVYVIHWRDFMSGLLFGPMHTQHAQHSTAQHLRSRMFIDNGSRATYFWTHRSMHVYIYSGPISRSPLTHQSN